MSKQKKRSGPGGPGRQQPRWQPIGMLPVFATQIDGMLEVDREQYQNLLPARSRPHVLDDFTVNRVREVFTKQRDGFGLFEAQLLRWQAETLTEDQDREVKRLIEQMRLLRENNANVLALAEELSQGTIEKMLAKPDVQLGFEMLKNWPR